MDNLIDRYLEFNAKGIASFVSILVKNSLNDFKLSTKFSDIIYDYLNEVSLASDVISDEELINITGLKVKNNLNMLLKLFIDYGVVSRMDLKDAETKKSYLFIVDATMFFISVLRGINTDKCGNVSLKSYFNKVTENDYYDLSLLKSAFNESIEEVEVVFYKFIEKESLILEVLNNDKFIINYSKINENMCLANIDYQNDEILNYGSREIEFVKKDYDISIFKNGLTLLGLDLIKSNLRGTDRKVFVCIPDYILKKKSFLKSLIDITRIYSFKKNIVLVINFEVTLELDDIVNYLYNEGYVIAINKDGDMPNNFDLGNAKYLLLDYKDDDEFKRITRKCADNYSMIITNTTSKSDRLECMNLGIEYFLK